MGTMHLEQTMAFILVFDKIFLILILDFIKSIFVVPISINFMSMTTVVTSKQV